MSGVGLIGEERHIGCITIGLRRKHEILERAAHTQMQLASVWIDGSDIAACGEHIDDVVARETPRLTVVRVGSEDAARTGESDPSG